MPSSDQVKAIQVPKALHEALVTVSAEQHMTVASLTRQILAHELLPLPDDDRQVNQDAYLRREGRLNRGELRVQCPAYVRGALGAYWDDRRSAARRREVPQ